MSTKSISLTLFIALLTIVVGYVIFIQKIDSPTNSTTTTITPPVQTTTPSTPELKLYRNEEWGFEFEYPRDWTLHLISDPFRGSFSQLQLIGTLPEEKAPNTIVPTFLVNVVTQDFADKAAINKDNLGTTTSVVVVGKTQVKKYEYNFSGQSRISIDLPFGEYRMLLSGSKKNETAFNQILTSFKFINLDKAIKMKTYHNEKYRFAIQIPNGWVPFENQGRLTLNNIPGQPFGDNLFFFIIPTQATTSEPLASWFSRNQELTETNAQEMFEVANRTYGKDFLKITDFLVTVENKVVDGQEAVIQTIKCLKSDCYFLGWPQHSKEYYIKRDDMVFKLVVITMQPETHFGLLDQIVSTLKFFEPSRSSQ